MADKAITYGASEGFGALTGWESKGTNDNTQSTRAVATDSKGDEVASKLHDEKQEVTENLECNNDTNSIPAAVGALVNSLILTEISINTSAEAYAQMTLTGHNHTENAHAASPALRTATHGITLTKAYGATDFLGGTAGDNASPISGSLTIKCDHVDQVDADGDHLVGENFNATMEAKTTWSGVPSVAAVAGWDVTVTSTVDEDTGFVKTEVTGVKKIAFS